MLRMTPIKPTNFNGSEENEMILLIAYLVFFLNVHILLPCSRAARSYEIYALSNPAHIINPTRLVLFSDEAMII